MKGNWEQTEHNRNVAVYNYYKEGVQMASVYGAYIKVWCPVQHRDKVAARMSKQIPAHNTITIRHDLPDVENAGRPLFEPYSYDRSQS